VVSIPLVVTLWEGPYYSGVKRTLVENTSDLGPWNFDKRTHSIGVHQGPDYDQLAAKFHLPAVPTVTFKSADPSDGELTLAAGGYVNLDGFSWGGRIHSVTFNYDPEHPADPGGRDPRTGQGFQLKRSEIKTIGPIPFVVDLWTGWSIRHEPEGYPPGTRLTLVESSPNLVAEFGDEFADGVGTIRVQRGPNYGGYDVVRLINAENYAGCYEEYGPGGWGPEGILPASWCREVSVLFTQPPRNPPLYALSPDKIADLLSIFGTH
jgi:hypothetical protein